MVKKEISIAAYVEQRKTTLGLRVQGSSVISAMNMDGHWAKVCTTKLKCSFCGDAEYSVEDCPKGSKSFSMATKRPSTDAAPFGPPKRISTAAVAPPASVTSDGMSYSRALS